jgi:hypothetical protein
MYRNLVPDKADDIGIALLCSALLLRTTRAPFHSTGHASRGAEGDGKEKNKKTHISRPCCYYKFSIANSQKRALLRNALSVRSAVSRPQNSLVECGNDKVRGFDASRYIAFSRELPAVAAVHALAEGSHRLVGGAGLGLCVGDLGLLALAAGHSVGERKVLALCDRYVFFVERNKDPIPHPLTQESWAKYGVSLLLPPGRLAWEILLVNTYVVEMAFCSVAVMATRMFSFSMAASAARFSADLRSSPDMLTVSVVSMARRSNASFSQAYQTCLG